MDPMKLSEEEIKGAMRFMRRDKHTGSLDFAEFIVDPHNDITYGWGEAAYYAGEYLANLGMTEKEKRAWLLEKMKEERNKRFTK